MGGFGLLNELCRLRILHMWQFCTSLLHSHMGSHTPSSEEKYTTEIDEKLLKTWDVTVNTTTASRTARFPSVSSCFTAHPFSMCICLCNDYKTDLTTSYCLWNNMHTHTHLYRPHTHIPVYTTHTCIQTHLYTPHTHAHLYTPPPPPTHTHTPVYTTNTHTCIPTPDLFTP